MARRRPWTEPAPQAPLIRDLPSVQPGGLAVAPPVALQEATPISHRIEIDWAYFMERRVATLRRAPVLPAYLLLPEVRTIINDFEERGETLWRLFFDTLWHTGARVSEALSLTPASFELNTAHPEVWLRVLKQKPKKRGRPRRSTKPVIDYVPMRNVPIGRRSAPYVRFLKAYLGSVAIGKHERLFPFTRQAVNKRLNTALERLRSQNKEPTIKVTVHTFRHSFAVNCLLHGKSLPVIQQWLGHSSIKSTEVYTKVLSGETHHFMDDVAFQ